MFSDRQYSLLRYSVNAGAREAPIAESFLEEVKAVIGSAVPVAVSERFAEAVQGSARGTVSLVFAFAAVSGSKDAYTCIQLKNTVIIWVVRPSQND